MPSPPSVATSVSVLAEAGISTSSAAVWSLRRRSFWNFTWSSTKTVKSAWVPAAAASAPKPMTPVRRAERRPLSSRSFVRSKVMPPLACSPSIDRPLAA